jgi:hypothetical protein
MKPRAHAILKRLFRTYTSGCRTGFRYSVRRRFDLLAMSPHHCYRTAFISSKRR